MPATRLKVIANVAVGYNNIDVAVRAVARRHRHEHAGRADRVGRRLHLGADPRHHAAAVRRRAAGAARRLEGLGVRLHARHRAARQAARARRLRPHRPRRRGAGAGVRHAGRLHQRGATSDVPDAERMSLDRLLNTSDVVSLHVPLTRGHAAPDRPAGAGADEAVGLSRSTRRADRWSTRRRSPGRSQQRLLAGAALDVYENEPAVHPDLLQLENVAARAASRQRHDRNAHGDGRSRGRQRRRRAARPPAADAGRRDDGRAVDAEAGRAR